MSLKQPFDFSVGLIRGINVQPVTSGRFESIIGQNEARSTLDFFIRSHNPKTPFPTLLFTGGHGLGKTYFSKKVAEALNREYIEINCGDIKTSNDFIHVVLTKIFEGNKPATILLDESHTLSTDLTTLLLTFLNPTSSHVNHFSFGGFNINWDMTLINVVLATTDAYKIFKPLRNRCQEIYFYPYADDELYEIVKGYVPDLTLLCSKKDLALTCRGRARDAYVLSTNIHRYMNISGRKDFTQNDLDILKGMLGVLPMGLKRAEVELLRAVKDHGPISASNLAIKLMVNQNNIEEELEIRLRELGMIDSSSRGRVVTDSGMRYLEQYAL
jgi:Holliday junction resolvasome RuvABC ATP-dependent DNA helicase subunit